MVSRWRRRLILVVAGVVALVTADAALGLVYRTGTNADVTVIPSRSGSTRRAIVVFPGYVMPGTILGRAFAPHVAPDDALVVVEYAQRGVDVERIYGQVMEALLAVRPTELRVYGASMGGMLGKLFLDRYRRAGAPFGKVVLVLDSAPASPSDVKRPSALFDLSCWYRGGPLSSIAWAAMSELGGGPPAEDDADVELVLAARRAGAWAGMPAATSQGCFIAMFPSLAPGALVDVADTVVYLHGDPPDDDPLVRISKSIAGWRIAFPGLRAVTVPGRAGRWHLPLIERPRETVRSVVATYAR